MARPRHAVLGALALAAWLAMASAAQSGLYPAMPYCACTKRPSAYSLSPTVKALGGGTFCWTVAVKPVGSTYCGSKADLRKIEFDVSSKCVVFGAKVNASIDGVPTKVGPSFDFPNQGPEGSAVLRLTQLGLGLGSDGAEVCITIAKNRDGKGCDTLEALCAPPPGLPAGVCLAALFDSQNDCCPLSNTGVPSPPPPSPPPPSPPPPSPPPPSPPPPSPPPPSPPPPPPPSPPPPSPPPPSPPPPSPPPPSPPPPPPPSPPPPSPPPPSPPPPPPPSPPPPSPPPPSPPPPSPPPPSPPPPPPPSPPPPSPPPPSPPPPSPPPPSHPPPPPPSTPPPSPPPPSPPPPSPPPPSPPPPSPPPPSPPPPPPPSPPPPPPPSPPPPSPPPPSPPPPSPPPPSPPPPSPPPPSPPPPPPPSPPPPPPPSPPPPSPPPPSPPPPSPPPPSPPPPSPPPPSPPPPSPPPPSPPPPPPPSPPPPPPPSPPPPPPPSPPPPSPSPPPPSPPPPPPPSPPPPSPPPPSPPPPAPPPPSPPPPSPPPPSPPPPSPPPPPPPPSPPPPSPPPPPPPPSPPPPCPPPPSPPPPSPPPPSPPPPSPPPPPPPSPPPPSPPPPSPPPPSPPPPSPPPPPPPSPPPPSPPPPHPPPPSPPPPSPPPPCRTCIAVEIVSIPFPDLSGFRFTPDICDAVSALIADDLNNYIDVNGVQIVSPYAAADCTAIKISVCATYFSAEEAKRVEEYAQEQAASYLQAAIGTGCGARVAAYTFLVSSQTPQGDLDDPCISVQYQSACALADQPFPLCKCNPTRLATPLAARAVMYSGGAGRPNGGKPTRLYCFNLTTVTPSNPKSKCGSASTLYKAEIWADDVQYRRAVSGFRVKPAGAAAPNWLSVGWGAVGEYVLRASPLNWNLTQVAGGEICFEVLASVPIEEFCLGTATTTCYISLFDQSKGCCPIYSSQLV